MDVNMQHPAQEKKKLDWNQLRAEIKCLPDPVIYLQQTDSEDGYQIFRMLSHKVAHCRYDIPCGHRVTVAYVKQPGRGDVPSKAVGVITYCIADRKCNAPVSSIFMDNFFHKISFLFVDQYYQRKGVGSMLLKAASDSIQASGIQRAIRLEGAKSAVKFFTKMGFSSRGHKTVNARKGSKLFWECQNMQKRF